MGRYSNPRKGMCSANSVFFCLQLGLVVSLIFTFVIMVYVLSLAIANTKYAHYDSIPTGAVRHSVNGQMYDVYNFTKPKEQTSPKSEQRSIKHAYYYLRKSFNLTASLIGQWINEREEFCGGKFVGHAHLFARLTNVVIDPKQGTGKKGGEEIDEVLGQAEEKEYFKLSPGYFNIICKKSNIYYYLARNDHLHNWLNALYCHKHMNYEVPITIRKVTIAVQRYEYANFYHTMTDYYNTFLTMLTYNIRPGNANTLWIDGHPNGNLDSTWRTLFGNVIRAGNITTPTFFKSLVWNMMGYNSPLMQHDNDHVPYLEEFRHFFLKRHNMEPYRNLDCANIVFTFLWRRDYRAHPRNAAGKIERKIKNENELVKAMRQEFPHSTVRGLQLDQYPMNEQLRYITKTDVLIGMHGAGLTHALFLQDHAALVELFPDSYPALHFKCISKWRGLRYAQWGNRDSYATYKGYTTVPAEIVVAMAKELTKSMCPSQSKQVLLA